MEELAKELTVKIDNICGKFHYFKGGRVLEESRELAGEIQQFCGYFLQGNIFGMEEEEYEKFQQYVVQVLEDYIEAMRQQDTVYMLDTLDYGLRELLNIYIDTDTGETGHGEGNI
ncbi:hypothetical protein C806_01002 [Lachnospiraceae bacterium 3-1]|nr:hypothetical protein C806_01002 [Lachnospiraceae bacterium 3-1]